MNSDHPAAKKEYAIPDEECLPKYFAEPAPTAEEQLPPHIQNLYESSKRDDYMIVGSEVRMVIHELRAALRSNREKDAQLAELHAVADAGEENRKEFIALLAEKAAKIAELEEQRDEWETHAGNHVDRIRKLEAKLRAVSEAAKEELPRTLFPAGTFCRASLVESLLSRIGKLAE